MVNKRCFNVRNEKHFSAAISRSRAVRAVRVHARALPIERSRAIMFAQIVAVSDRTGSAQCQPIAVYRSARKEDFETRMGRSKTPCPASSRLVLRGLHQEKKPRNREPLNLVSATVPSEGGRSTTADVSDVDICSPTSVTSSIDGVVCGCACSLKISDLTEQLDVYDGACPPRLLQHLELTKQHKTSKMRRLGKAPPLQRNLRVLLPRHASHGRGMAGGSAGRKGY
ncbi:hypothetical protein HPB52_008138 [Rhipicephalus sanguineus]|uniref:Uncharacterized protein n=1 Tax=Rhipicephalus sanguineus TaxID=34632 RepID=A0A9D4SW86_RHISA|nr:hypothetical protein HPB52_008138 [Rhipicephalus sanguineus]